LSNSNLKRWIRAGPALTVLAVFAAFLLGRPQTQGHDFSGKCDFCHVGLKDPSLLTRECDSLCLSCHAGADVLSHPSGFSPGKSLPPVFPLFRGKMTCGTCHFPPCRAAARGDESAPPAAGPSGLRSGESGRAFCIQCHTEGLNSFASDSHAQVVRRAHSPAFAPQLKEAIDTKSRECLSCHDGTLSSAQTPDIGGVQWEHGADIGLSHPIAVDYAEVYRRNSRTYHRPELLDSRVRLFGGRIACETCHDHYSKIGKKLVMDNGGSRLCLSCHNL
jgi:predicted CXXCH cytochrome family protein